MDEVEKQSIIKKYRDNPILFMEEMLNYKFSWYQKQIIKMMLLKDRCSKGFRVR